MNANTKAAMAAATTTTTVEPEVIIVTANATEDKPKGHPGYTLLDKDTVSCKPAFSTGVHYCCLHAVGKCRVICGPSFSLTVQETEGPIDRHFFKIKSIV